MLLLALFFANRFSVALLTWPLLGFSTSLLDKVQVVLGFPPAIFGNVRHAYAGLRFEPHSVGGLLMPS